MTVEVITPREWSDVLALGAGSWSPLAGPSAVVVDGPWGSGRLPGGDARRPPIPVIGRLRAPLSASELPLAVLCDALVGGSGDEAPGAVGGGEDAVAPVAATVHANPQAASVFCQVLRGAADVDVAAGLLVESLAYATLQSGAEHQAWLADRAPVGDAVARVPVESSGVLELERHGTVLAVRLNRPEVHNALDVRMRDALVEAFDLAVADPSIAEIRVTAAGRSFCSGGDLKEFGSAPDPATAHLVRSLRLPARALARVADRVHMTVHGASVGAGVELAAFAWSVQARPDATFRLPEIGMGLVPGAGGTVSLPRRIGRPRTAWLGLSGVEIDASTARDWGLIERIVDGP